MSDNNGTVNWATVANQGYKFAFIKATEGITFTDSTFATNWASAKQNNILRGAYHYFRAIDDPVAQANHFLQVVPSLAPGDLPSVLDLEDDAKGTVTGTALLNAVQQWLTQAEEGLNRTPLIYVSPSFWQSSLANGQNPNRFSSHYPYGLHNGRKPPTPTLQMGGLPGPSGSSLRPVT